MSPSLAASLKTAATASLDNDPTKSKESLVGHLERDYEFLDHSISHDNLFQGVYDLFAKWKPDVPKEKLVLKQFTEGMTNKLVLVTMPELNTDKVLVRVYGRGSGCIIDREQELANMMSIHRAGEGPELFARFINGYVYGFLEGTPLRVEDLGDPMLSRRLAQRMAIWHGIAVPGDREPKLFKTLDTWVAAVPESFADAGKQAKFAKLFRMDELRAELTMLRGVLTQLESPTVFCHNDLLCANVLYDAPTQTMNFIDYEYGNYNYRAFDIGNHFCEHAGMEEPVDYSRYPDKPFQLAFIRAYLAAWRGVPEAQVEAAELAREYAAVNKFALAAHFYWGSWALVQAYISDINYDYLEYAHVRFSEYYRRKEEFLALQ